MLHPGQHEVFAYKSRFKVVVAGRRWGKTQLSKAALVNAGSVKNRLIWYVAPTYRMAKQIMWRELQDAIPSRWIRRKNETTMTIELINNSIIELKGADKPDTLRGVGLHYVVMDEFQDMKPETWTKVLRPTLATTGGHALFIGTPKAFNHLYDAWILGQDGVKKSGQWKSWQYPTIMSPFVPESEIESAKRDMDEKSFKQEFLASFETMSGRVYYPFDRKVHTGDYKFNPKLPIYIGQDFNIDPMSSVIFQIQDSGEVWVVDEIILFGSNTEETCEEIEKRYWRHMKQITIYPDPAGKARQHARGETDLDIFREKGLNRLKFHRKHPAIADRVNSVNRMLRSADGQVRLRVDNKCRQTIESFEQTIYKEGSREINKAMSVEHATDAAGYFLEFEFPVRKLEVAGISL